MAKTPSISAASVRTAGPFTEPRPLSSAGGLVQSGGYLNRAANLQQRNIQILSRPHFAMPIKTSPVGGKQQKLPKGMD